MSKKFNEMYQDIPTAIDFNQNWANGTGYYDHAVHGDHSPKLEVGQIVKSVSPMPNNRRIIIVGTPVGNVVLFDRFTDGDLDVIVGNVPDGVERLFGLSGQMKEEMIDHFLGDIYSGEPYMNIGQRLKGWNYESPRAARKRLVAKAA